MPIRREIPIDPSGPESFKLESAPPPDSDLQALMEAAPGDNPRVSNESTLSLRDTIQDAIETLTPREQMIFDAVAVEKLSFAQVARRLGLAKSTVYVIYGKVQTKLQIALRTMIEE